MRTKTILMLVLLATAAMGCRGMSHRGGGGHDDIEKTVRGFVLGGDKRDVKLLEHALHPRFRAVVTFGDSGKFTIISRTQYLGLIKAGKIGGVTRRISIDAVERHGNIATVRARLNSKVLSFNARYSLVREAGDWKLVQDQVVARKSAKH